MGIFDRFKKENRVDTISSVQLISDQGSNFYAFGNKLYKSDIVRSAIRPKARAVGKAIAKHILSNNLEGVNINPNDHIKMLLKEPNQIMSGQDLQEKLVTQLELNNNAFALISKDENSRPIQIVPIDATNVEALQTKTGKIYLRFSFLSGKVSTFDYDDIIHLRKDFNSDWIFGESPVDSILPLMEVISTVDQGIINAVKNSTVIQWLLKFNSVVHPDKMKEKVNDFVKSFISTNQGSGGAAGIDISADAQQVEPKDYVPDSKTVSSTIERVLSFFNTNLDIINSSYDEDKWISFYEAQVEPELQKLSSQYTRKLFTRKERERGNEIIFESSDLSYASMSTKLDLVLLVDRGLMSEEEFRSHWNMGPKNSNHTFVRRLDTAVIKNDGKERRKTK